jgi:two-component system NtrC family sensor kinase
MLFSLKNKLALTVCLLLAVTLTAAATGVLHFYSAELKATISQQQFSVITEIADAIDEQIRAGNTIITRTATNFPADILADPDVVQRYLDQRLGEGTLLFFDNGIFFFSPGGDLLAEYPFKEGRRGKNFAFRDYFQKTIKTRQPQISEPYFSSQKHRHPAIVFTAPIFDDTGELSAVIAGSVDLTNDNFLGRLGKFKIGASGYLYLYNTDRLMIMHPDASRILQKDVPVGVNPLFDRAIAGFEGSGETVNSRGIAMLSSFKRLATTDWILAANYPVSEAFASVAKSKRYISIGFLLLLFSTTLVVWFFMRYLSRPLLDFTHHVQRLTKKDASRTPLPITTDDEIGLLGTAFNRLMDEVEVQKDLSSDLLRFLQTISDAIPNPVYYKDLQRRYLGCNRAYEEIRGVSRSELLGKTTSEIVDTPEAKELDLDEFELLNDSNLPEDFTETSMLYSDGSQHEILICRAVFHDDQGAAAGLVGTFTDITHRKTMENALNEQQLFVENLLQNSAVPTFVVDSEHQVITWNLACEELTGFTAFDMLATNQQWRAFYPEERSTLADLIIDGDLESTIDLYQTFSSSQLIAEGLQAEGWYANVGGKRRYLSFDAAPIRDRQGNVIAAIETLQDHTGLKQTEEALRRSEENFRSLTELSPDAILVHRGGEVVFGNKAAAFLFGAATTGQLTGVRIMDLVHPDYRAIVQRRISEGEFNQGEKSCFDEKILRFNGEVVDVEVCSTPVFYHEEWSVQSILRDITERKELQEQVWRQANYDGLTGLPNRLLFNDRLQQAIERAAREDYAVALMFIDLDRFKEINDTLGHDAGDSLLQQAAKRMEDALRKSDTLARMGGDEFTVIMPCVVEPLHVGIVARRLLETLSQPFNLPGGEGRISGSIGVAFYPRDARDIPMLLHHADIAMYRAKESGRNAFRLYSAVADGEADSF